LSKLIWFLPILLLALIGCQSQVGETVNPARLKEVADRGAQVMSFDLERTTHIFEKQDNGGLSQMMETQPKLN